MEINCDSQVVYVPHGKMNDDVISRSRDVI